MFGILVNDYCQLDLTQIDLCSFGFGRAVASMVVPCGADDVERILQGRIATEFMP